MKRGDLGDLTTCGDVEGKKSGEGEGGGGEGVGNA